MTYPASYYEKIKIDYDILETFLCEEEKQYFIEWDKNWMNAVGGYGYDNITHSIVTYYITRTGHINVQIPVKDYIALYIAKERDKKLESIGI
jgi:hypothetical protein